MAPILFRQLREECLAIGGASSASQQSVAPVASAGQPW